MPINLLTHFTSINPRYYWLTHKKSTTKHRTPTNPYITTTNPRITTPNPH